MKRGKQPQSTQSPHAETQPCIVPTCGRPAYARRLCQTHHRQLLTTGKLNPIRPYRQRSLNTIKFSGLRLSETTAKEVERKATREGISRSAAITAILEEWERSERSGAQATSVVA